MALYGTLRFSQLTLMACENVLFFVLVAMCFLSGVLPVSLASWESSGKYMFADYPWYPVPKQGAGAMKPSNIETAFLSGVKVGVFAELMILAISTFFYVEYRMVQQMIECVIEKKRTEDEESA